MKWKAIFYFSTVFMIVLISCLTANEYFNILDDYAFAFRLQNMSWISSENDVQRFPG